LAAARLSSAVESFARGEVDALDDRDADRAGGERAGHGLEREDRAGLQGLVGGVGAELVAPEVGFAAAERLVGDAAEHVLDDVVILRVDLDPLGDDGAVEFEIVGGLEAGPALDLVGDAGGAAHLRSDAGLEQGGGGADLAGDVGGGLLGDGRGNESAGSGGEGKKEGANFHAELRDREVGDSVA
jgi:hypothetical protein